MIEKIVVKQQELDLQLVGAFISRTSIESANKLLIDFTQHEMTQYLTKSPEVHWHTSVCSNQELQRYLQNALESGNYLAVSVFALMLEARNRIFTEIPLQKSTKE